MAAGAGTGPARRAYSCGSTEITRPRRPALNCTTPGRDAKIVSSLPMPTPSPGRKRVPRWRTMISPPLTVWPANTFTPRRLAFESRPLRLEPSPFLCAISGFLVRLGPRAPAGDLDARHLDAGQLLAVAGAALVAALGLELEHAQLRAALVTDDLGLDLDLAESVAEQGLVAGVQERLELERGALVALQALHEQGRALLDAVLLTAGLDDCVGHGWDHSSLEASVASAPALARERRRPPLRPRRRGFDSTASPSSEASDGSSGAVSPVSSAVPPSPSSPPRARERPRPLRRRRAFGASSPASSAAAGPVPAPASVVSVSASTASASVAASTPARAEAARAAGRWADCSRSLRRAAPFFAAALRLARCSAFSRSFARSPAAAPAASASAPVSDAVAVVRRASSMRTSFFSPTKATPSVTVIT